MTEFTLELSDLVINAVKMHNVSYIPIKNWQLEDQLP